MLARSDRDPIEVSDNLITVSKGRKDVGKADVAGIEIRVVTDSSAPVAFRLVEQFPEGVSMDDLAVHPQFSPDKWTIYEPERRMVFEDVVAPDEEVVTLYGVLEAKYDSLEPFLGEPKIAISQQADPGTTSDGGQRLFRGSAAAAVDVGDSAAADGAIDLERLLETGAKPEPSADGEPADEPGAEPEPSADGEPVAPTDPEPDRPTDPEPAGGRDAEPSPGARSPDEPFVFKMAGSGTADASEADPGAAGRTASPSRAAGAPDGADESTDATVGSLDLGNASVVAAFIDELESGAPSDEQLTALRDALDLEPAESMRLRVSHLQSEVADLSAYADEFERFVDQEGSFSGALDEFHEDVDRVEGYVDELSADARAAAEERTELRDRVDQLEGELASLRESHESSVGGLSSRIDDVETGSVDADEVEAVREELRAERAWRRKVVASLEALAEDAADADIDR